MVQHERRVWFGAYRERYQLFSVLKSVSGGVERCIRAFWNDFIKFESDQMVAEYR